MPSPVGTIVLTASASSASATGQPIQVTGILQGARAIYAEGGFSAFWRGNGINLIKVKYP